MEEKEQNPQTNRKQVTENARHKVNALRKKIGLTPLSRWLQNAFYLTWTLIGLVVVVAFIAALLGNGSLTENLQLNDTQETTQQQTQAPQQQAPPQPSEEQLSCISDELGQERLTELEQGQPATQEESVVIQECLQ